jgi:hypothetical protein
VDDAGAFVFTVPTTVMSKIILGDDTTLRTKRRKSRWQSREDRTTTSTYFKGKTGSLAIVVGKAMDFNLPSMGKSAWPYDTFVILADRCSEGGNMWVQRGLLVVDAEFAARNFEMRRIRLLSSYTGTDMDN